MKIFTGVSRRPDRRGIAPRPEARTAMMALGLIGWLAFAGAAAAETLENRAQPGHPGGMNMPSMQMPQMKQAAPPPQMAPHPAVTVTTPNTLHTPGKPAATTGPQHPMMESEKEPSSGGAKKGGPVLTHRPIGHPQIDRNAIDAPAEQPIMESVQEPSGNPAPQKEPIPEVAKQPSSNPPERPGMKSVKAPKTIEETIERTGGRPTELTADKPKQPGTESEQEPSGGRPIPETAMPSPPLAPQNPIAETAQESPASKPLPETVTAPVMGTPGQGTAGGLNNGEADSGGGSAGAADFQNSGVNISPDLGAKDIGSGLSSVGQYVPGTAGTVLKTGGEVLQSGSLGEGIVKATGIKGDGWADIFNGLATGNKDTFGQGAKKLGDYLGTSAVTLGVAILIAALGGGALVVLLIGAVLAWTGLGKIIGGAISAAFQWAAGKIFDLVQAIGQTAIGQFIGAVLSAVGSALAAAFNFVVSVISDIVTAFANSSVGQFIIGAVNAAIGAVGAVVGAVVGFVFSVVGAVAGVVSTVVGAIGSFVSAVGSALSSAAGAVAGAIGDAVSAVVGAIGDALSAIGDVIGDVGSAIGDFVGDVVNAVGDFVGSIGDAIVSFFSGGSGDSTDQPAPAGEQDATSQDNTNQDNTTQDNSNQDNTNKDDNSKDNANQDQQNQDAQAKDDNANTGGSTKVGGESGGDQSGATPEESGGGGGPVSQQALDMLKGFNQHSGDGTDFEGDSIGTVSPSIAQQENYLTGGDSDSSGGAASTISDSTRLTGSHTLDGNKLGADTAGPGGSSGAPGTGSNGLTGATQTGGHDGTGIDVHLGDHQSDPFKQAFADAQQAVEGAAGGG